MCETQRHLSMKDLFLSMGVRKLDPYINSVFKNISEKFLDDPDIDNAFFTTIGTQAVIDRKVLQRLRTARDRIPT